ncbi:MAG: FKBP-type peptidyl-prolyl cis-trans isomerase [Chloroflexi bacterium]|nr:FKBP-type peptidyl-prolyl cis-trans isomerase [Chloroflexota bacterium]MDA1241336.1 FKBP-type peptidyl-prolyl cis-trans isomerase [Chloroflexota bacterium]
MPADGDLVEFHFHGTLADGSVFDSSRGRSARYFVLGRGQLLRDVEAALRGMAPGARRTLHVPFDRAYGPHDPAEVYVVPRSEAPPGAAAGDEVQLSDGRPARITALDAESVTVDANHALAGQALTFEIELISSRPGAT